MEIILQFPFRKNVKQINILQKISLTLHFYEVALHIRILTGALIFTVRLRFPPCSWDRNCFVFFLSLSPPLVIPDGEHFQLSTSRQEMGLYGTRHVPNCWFIRRTKYEPGISSNILLLFGCSVFVTNHHCWGGHVIPRTAMFDKCFISSPGS